RLLTLAPELPGSEAVVARAQESQVVVGMGHSDATMVEAQAAAATGIRYAVHTFNAMREFHHREPGIAGAALSDDRIYAELIADGVHVAPEVVRVFARSKPVERHVLVTDSVSACGMPDGHYRLGSYAVEV